MNNKATDLRYKLKLSQSAMARELGVARQVVWRYETGRTEPSLAIIKKLISLAAEHKIKVKAGDFIS